MLDSRIISFTDLKAWQHGHKLVVEIYAATNEFPKDEKYNLTSQLRRASVSVTSNLAEGFGRAGSKEKDQFYSVSVGSIIEVENQLLIAKDVGFLDQKDFDRLAELAVLTHKLINGLRKANRSRKKMPASNI